MTDLTILKEKNPATAEFVEHWRAKYQRAYDFSKTEDQADFYEGCLEMARHIATNSTTGTLKASTNSLGVSSLDVFASPSA